MKTRTLPLLLICAGTVCAQVTLNPVPTREIGHPRLPTPFQLDTANPNLVEGRELYQPSGIAVDTNATPPILYVADTQNNRIMVWQNALTFSSGKPADRIIGQLDPYSTAVNGAKGGTQRTTALSAPSGLAVLNGDLYVVDTGNNRILRFRKPLNTPADQQPVPDLCIGQQTFNTAAVPNAPNRVVSNQGIALNLGGGTLYTGAIAFDSANNLWFTDAGNSRVLRFPASAISGNNVFLPSADLEIGQETFTTKAATLPSTQQGMRTRNLLNTPSALAFDSKGRLYIADSNPGDPVNFSRIMVYAPQFTNGMSATRIMGVITPPAQGAPNLTDPQVFSVLMANPSGIFFLPGSQGIGILDSGYSRILLFDPFEQWPDEGTAFSPSAKSLVGHQAGISGLSQTDNRSRNSNDGNAQSSASTFNLPQAAVVVNNELFVADTYNNRVLVLPFANNTFAPSVRLLGQDRYDSNAPNLIEGREFNFALAGSADAGMALDTTGDTPRLYVSDPANHRILGFKDLRTLKAGAAADLVIGQPDKSTSVCNYPTGDPNKPTQSSLCRPIGLLVDAAGNLYVADSLNSRVLRFPAPFSHVGNEVADVVLGQADFFSKFTDATPRNLRLPYGLAFLGSNGLAVSDQAQNRVLYFPFTNGTFTGADNGKAATKVFGQNDFTSVGSGNSDTSLNAPHHVGSDTDGRPYVVDTGNGRVVIFDQIGQAPATGAHATLILPGINSPTGINVNPNTGEVWVAEYSSNQIRRYPKFDTLIFRPNPLDALPAVDPLSVVQDQYGDLLVADVSNRVTFYFPGMAATNGANFIAGRFLAPGAFATLKPNAGGKFGKDTADFNSLPKPVPYPKALADVQVLINDTPAPLTYVSPDQINFVVPWGTPTGGNANLQVVKISTGQVLAASSVAMNTVSPGIFNDTANTTVNHQAAVINNKDGSINSPTNPVARGEIVQIYTTGLGPVTETPADGDVPKGQSNVTGNVRVVVGTCFLDSCPLIGTETRDFYFGAALSPQFPGVYQVNVRIPMTTDPTSPAIILITVDSTASNVPAATGYNTVVYVKQ